jgi:hypothetical protein
MKKCQSEADFDAFINSGGTTGGRPPASAALGEMLIPPSTPAAERKPDVTPSFADVWTADIGFGFGERVSFFSDCTCAISDY